MAIRELLSQQRIFDSAPEEIYQEIQAVGQIAPYAPGEVIVSAGQPFTFFGVVLEGEREHPLKPGTVVLVPPNQPHQFRNTGSGALRFLCLIPHPLRGMTGPCAAACGCD